MICPKLLACVFAIAPICAIAADGNYRVVEIKPAIGGAELKLTYESEARPGLSPPMVSLFVYKKDPKGGQETGDQTRGEYHAHGGIKVRQLKWRGTGSAKVKLDYAKLGLKPGTALYTSCNFFGEGGGSWGHNWGDPWAPGRCANGGQILPEPLVSGTKNSTIRRHRARRFYRSGLSTPRSRGDRLRLPNAAK